MLTTLCPITTMQTENILLAHGNGGKQMQQLLTQVIIPQLYPQTTQSLHDAAELNVAAISKLAITTDSYVINPLFFPGGDIGSLAVHGTINDLAMAGAKPLAISVSLILEEGFAIAKLKKILASIRETAENSGIEIVTGDTKVVERGKGDGIFINTCGIGINQTQNKIHPEAIKAGDVVLLSGDIARHGLAIMLSREGLEFESTIESDAMSVWPAVQALIVAGIEIHCMRDLTRGGLASSLVEFAQSTKGIIEINEADIPILPAVASGCEVLGLDPLQVACEGRFVAFVPEEYATAAIEILKKFDLAATAIGKVSAIEQPEPRVRLKTSLGSVRAVEMLSGELLPRIC